MYWQGALPRGFFIWEDLDDNRVDIESRLNEERIWLEVWFNGKNHDLPRHWTWA